MLDTVSLNLVTSELHLVVPLSRFHFIMLSLGLLLHDLVNKYIVFCTFVNASYFL